MLDFLIPGHPGHSPVDILIQVATLAAGLLIAAALKYWIDALRRSRAQRKAAREPELP
jgi:hypothetical protein